MKRLLMTAALAVSVVGAYAQGTITFSYSGASPFTWNAPGSGKTGPVLAAEGVRVGLYYKDSATTYKLVGNPWYLGTLSTGNTNNNFGGKWNAGDVTVDGLVAGQTGTFQVRAWSGGFASYEAAVAGGALYGTGPGATSLAVDFQNPSGGAIDPGTGIAGLPASLSGFPGGQTVGLLVPEPSTYALAGLGLGALFLIRRRK
jgi:hypothetical protein